MFDYMILSKIPLHYESFWNEFSPVVTSDRNIRSGTKSGRTYHFNEAQVHSGKELGKWIGWADQLTHIFDLSTFLSHFYPERELLCNTCGVP